MVGVAEVLEPAAKVIAKEAAADAEQKHYCPAALDILYNRGEVGKGLLLRNAFKVVVAAKEEQNDFGFVSVEPVYARQAVGCGVAGHANVDDGLADCAREERYKKVAHARARGRHERAA